MTFLLIGIGMFVLAGALALLVAGMRGRRINNHPRCRKCSFDLFGVYPGVEVCPECGGDVTRNAAVVRGIRVRRPRFIAIGSVVLVLAMALGSVGVYSGMTGFDWNTIKPVWMLLREAESQSIATRDDAIGEFARRLTDDELSEEATARVLDAALDHQADTTQAWVPAWGEVFTTALANDRMSGERERRFLRHLVAHEIEPRVRIRPGDRLPIERRAFVRGKRASSGVPFQSSAVLRRTNRAPRPPVVTVLIEPFGAVLDGEHEVPMDGEFTESFHLVSPRILGPLGDSLSSIETSLPLSTVENGSSLRVPIHLEPGAHTLTVYLGVQTGLGERGLPRYLEGGPWDLNGRKPLELIEEIYGDGVLSFVTPIDVEFEVVADPADSHRPIDDPTLAEEILGCFGHPRINVAHEDDRTWVTIWLTLDEQPPAQLAFDVYLRDGERWWPVSTVTWCNPPTADFGRGVWLSIEWSERVDDFPGAGPPWRFAERVTDSLLDVDAEYVDIVLIPSETAAVDSLHVFEPWHGELVIENVPVSINDLR